MPMNTQQETGTHIVSDLYEGYRDVQAHLVVTHSRKVRNAIFAIAALLFGSELLSLMMRGNPSAEVILYSAIIPLIVVGMGFLATRQPLVAIILVLLVFVAIIVLSIIVYGSRGAFSGALVKIIILYFLLAGIQSARQAERAKKELTR